MVIRLVHGGLFHDPFGVAAQVKSLAALAR